MRDTLAKIPVRISLSYWVIAGLWILLSDRIVFRFALGVETAHHIQTYKGWFFVTVTAVLLYGLLRQQLARWQEEATERVRAETALSQSYEQLRLLIEQAPVNIAMFDRQMCYLTASHRWKVNFKLQDQPDLRGRSHYEVFPHLPERWKEVHQKALAGATIYNDEDKWIQPDGSCIWSRWAVQPWFDFHGEIGGIVISTEDITERKKSEQQLRQWADAFEHCSLGLALVNPDTNTILACNPAFAEMQNMSMSEIIGVPILSFYPPDERELVQSQIIEADKTGKVQYESVIQQKNGALVPVQVDVATVFDEKGNGLYRVATRQDISWRKQAEESLRFEKERLEKLAMVSPSAMYSFRVAPDGKRTLLYSSPVNYELFGFTPSESEKSSEIIFSRIHPQDSVHMMEVINTTKDTHSVLHETYRYAHPEKGDIWIEIFVASTLEADGSVTWHGVANDVTERKQAEETLRRSEERLKLALAAAGMGVWSWNLKTKEVFWSPECYELFRVETFADTLEGFFKLVHPEDIESLKKTAKQAIAQKENFTSQFRSLLPDGTIRWYSNLGRVEYDEQGEATYLTGTVQDITERKLAEVELEQSLKQVRSLALHLQDIREEERKRIARELHDELGQALAGLKFDLYALENQLATSDATLRNEYRERIHAMAGLINSTIEVGRKIATELRPRILDDLGLVAALRWQAHEFQTRAGIECSFKSSMETVVVDVARATAVFRIFQETLTNVARHANASSVRATLDIQNDHLLLQVEDNGRGIRKRERTDLHSLGLLGMRERLLPFGGNIRIYGQANKGTSITVSLPLQNIAQEGGS